MICVCFVSPHFKSSETPLRLKPVKLQNPVPHPPKSRVVEFELTAQGCDVDDWDQRFTSASYKKGVQRYQKSSLFRLIFSLGTASALFFSVIQEPLPAKLPPFQVPSNEQNPELNVDNVDNVNTHSSGPTGATPTRRKFHSPRS